MDDAELVAAFLGGDTEAFATIYDRYADRIHDFCHSVLRDRAEAADAMQDTFIIAARRVGQLRDASKLRSWLFAIARNEALRRAKKQSRVVPTDDERFRHLAAPDEDVDAGMSGDDAREIVWAAAAGLNERDRVLLDLHLRQGLDGQELADAIGVSPSHAYVMMNRLRTQMERALGALLIARLGREDCDDLAAILRGWDGSFSVLIRKRVARHVEQCETCEERRRSLVAPLAAFAAVPALPAGAASRAYVLDRVREVAASSPRGDGSQDSGSSNNADDYSWDGDGFPRPPRAARFGSPGGGRRRALVALGAAAIIIGGGGGYLAATGGDGRGGGVEIVADTGDATTTSGTTSERAPTTTHTDSPAVGASTSTSPSTTIASTTTAPDVPATDPPPTTTPAAPTTTTPTDAPPTLEVDADPTEIWTWDACGPTTSWFTATATDDHGIARVWFSWTSKYSGSGAAEFTIDDPYWYGSLGGLSNVGYDDTITVTATARDTVGQRTSVTFTLTLRYCLV